MPSATIRLSGITSILLLKTKQRRKSSSTCVSCSSGQWLSATRAAGRTTFSRLSTPKMLMGQIWQPWCALTLSAAHRTHARAHLAYKSNTA